MLPCSRPLWVLSVSTKSSLHGDAATRMATRLGASGSNRLFAHWGSTQATEWRGTNSLASMLTSRYVDCLHHSPVKHILISPHYCSEHEYPRTGEDPQRRCIHGIRLERIRTCNAENPSALAKIVRVVSGSTPGRYGIDDREKAERWWTRDKPASTRVHGRVKTRDLG